MFVFFSAVDARMWMYCTAGDGGAPARQLLSYHSTARPGSFQARDNISQFIGWCRSTLAVPDTLLFETEDLVSRRNERNVLLCLLEVQYRPSALARCSSSGYHHHHHHHHHQNLYYRLSNRNLVQ